MDSFLRHSHHVLQSVHSRDNYVDLSRTIHIQRPRENPEKEQLMDDGRKNLYLLTLLDDYKGDCDCIHQADQHSKFTNKNTEQGSPRDTSSSYPLYIWIDHFVGEESRSKSFGSIMISFANFSTEVRHLSIIIIDSIFRF